MIVVKRVRYEDLSSYLTLLTTTITLLLFQVKLNVQVDFCVCGHFHVLQHALDDKALGGLVSKYAKINVT